MNYFEMLEVQDNETNEQTLNEAYQRARIKWQTLLGQGIGEQQRLARELMNGELESAYETLRDPARRQQYLRQLKLAQETGIPMSHGRVRVNFTLTNGHADHDFLVVENPVRQPLETTEGLSIGSIQEYVCRAWERPGMTREHLQDRTLDRWLYYSAAEADIATAIRYLHWEPDGLEANSQLFMVLDWLQSKYPAPILPCSPADWIEQLPSLHAPQWRIEPLVANFGLLTAGAPTTLTLFVKSWQHEPEEMTAAADHPAVRLDLSQLHNGRINVAIQLEQLERGEIVKSIISVRSSELGEYKLPLFAARPNRMLGNRELANEVNGLAGDAAVRAKDYRAALRLFRVAEAQGAAARAAKALLERAYARHDWFGVINLARYYKDQYQGGDDQVQLWLVEALRVVAGSIYQLGEHRRALEYLAALAIETAQIQDRQALAASWTAEPNAQFRLNLDDPKADWIDLAEHYELNWTHASGRADGSHYSGEVPLDLSARRIVWRSKGLPPLKAPLLAYEGIVLALRQDNRGVVALDGASGKQSWSQVWQATSQMACAPVAGDMCFFVTDPAGKLHALDAYTGNVKWSVQLDDARDISLAYSDGLVYIGTGKRLVMFHSSTGEQLAATDEMKTFFGWMDSNPVNILISDACCLFQKVGGVDASMVFVDMKTGHSLEFATPIQRSWASSLIGSMFAGAAWTKTAWAAYEGEIYVPYMITKELECRSQYRDSDGKVREKVEHKSWGELHFFVYNARHNEIVAHVWRVTWGTAYEENKQCRITVKEVRSAKSCAVAPAYVEIKEETNIVYPVQPGKPLHRVVAAGFGREIYYWISTDRVVKQVGQRSLDSDVQSIAYLGLYDLATTTNSLSTSFLGNTGEGNATAYSLSGEIEGAVGSPALYGDVIYLLTRSGAVVALGR